jgi:hypothetical protein
LSRAEAVVCSELAAISHVSHGFFTRNGGVSSGIYDSLNVGLGSSDDPEAVRENRKRIATALGVASDRLAHCYQVHSPVVVTLREPFATEAPRPHADALVTAMPGLALGVTVADCGPLLFADPQARVVGAAHAGWKGAFTGVAEATLAAMEALGARRGAVLAVLGPSIRRESYEVGPEFVARFCEGRPENARYFTPSPKPGHAMFDLPAYTGDRLRAAGVGRFIDLGLDTYADEARFFSYRRTTHRREPDYGRMMAGIALV